MIRHKMVFNCLQLISNNYRSHCGLRANYIHKFITWKSMHIPRGLCENARIKLTEVFLF